MKKWTPWIIVAGVILILYMLFGGTYNALVQKQESVTSSWAQVENVYQRRADLVPNLVETVKGFARQEKDVLTSVVEARAKATQTKVNINDAQSFAKFQQAQGELSSALSRLMVVVERYPVLRSSENFLALQTQLEGTENRIAVERRRFNEAAREFNTYRRQFPNNIMANIFGFGEKGYFEADAGAEKVPEVKF